jgi:hypothetical protein
MEASTKTYVGGAPEKSSEGNEAMGAQLIAEELKKQVRKKSSFFHRNNLSMFECFLGC